MPASLLAARKRNGGASSGAATFGNQGVGFLYNVKRGGDCR
jgi:hypothetical protein